jgi:hypothetical protein
MLTEETPQVRVIEAPEPVPEVKICPCGFGGISVLLNPGDKIETEAIVPPKPERLVTNKTNPGEPEITT